jgi:hypothetical protein
MSRCAIITFRGGKADAQIEFHNAWLGAARIWDALYDKYLKNPTVPYDSWLFGLRDNQHRLWDLVNRTDLPIHERIVHASTLDLAYINKEHFPEFCADLRKFDSAFPSECSHLTAWADAIEKLDCEAIGFWGTSVGENPWCHFNEEKDEAELVPLSSGWEIYDTLRKFVA